MFQRLEFMICTQMRSECQQLFLMRKILQDLASITRVSFTVLVGIASFVSETMTMTIKSLAKRWLTLLKEIKELDKKLEELTKTYAVQLRARFGVGPNTAALLLSVAVDNPERLKSEAALAALCGVNPLPASSGKTIRHRLNRGGSRAANNALWTIAMVRMRSDPRMRIYVERRTKEGLSLKEIHRCLKRHIVRELYPLILGDLKAGASNG